MPSMFKLKLRVGSYTGDQAFSSWLANQNRQILKESERRMFKASGYCRTAMRREFPRKRKAVEGYKGYGWASHPPSTAPKAPRRRQKGKRGLQYVTFKQQKRFSFRIGPDMFPSGGFGKNTKFKGDIMHSRGGKGLVKLPLHISQLRTLPGSMVQAAFANPKNWPMAWKMSHYKKRDFLTNPAKVTVKQFPRLFANLNVKG